MAQEKNRKHKVTKYCEQTKNTLYKGGFLFCSAKWTPVTVHIHISHTHSCHPTPTHKIPVKDTARYSYALLYTLLKKRRRKVMS